VTREGAEAKPDQENIFLRRKQQYYEKESVPYMQTLHIRLFCVKQEKTGG
jgi:hypothetical protein